MQITIEKLIFGGQGFARVDNHVYVVWNALPGETVEVRITKRKKDYIEAIATNIITPSPNRIEPRDTHFLSTSPWQIMSYDTENEWKQKIAHETYTRLGKQVGTLIQPDIVYDDKHYAYRNKMEFSFTEDANGKISLAFFQRGGKSKLSIHSSALATPQINDIASRILTWVHDKQIPLRSLKSLIIRSNEQGHVIAGLFIKDKLSFDDFPILDTTLVGFHLYYSTHRSPASVPTELLHTSGTHSLTTQIRDARLTYGLMSFFQVHIPMFTRALDDIATYIPQHAHILDFYSGVGSIGIPLSHHADSLTMVDTNDEAIGYANANIIANQITHAHAYASSSENSIDMINSNTALIVDPPRAGLHHRVVSRILEAKPATVIYLSCDLATHARDLALLYPTYTPTFSRVYNFFPRTPHIEGLCVLQLS